MQFILSSAFASLGLTGIITFFGGDSSKMLFLFFVVSTAFVVLLSRANISSHIQKKEYYSFFFTLFVILGCGSTLWALSVFPLYDPQQVALTIGGPLNGFFGIFVRKFIVETLAPILISFICLVPWLCKLSRYRRIMCQSLICLLVVGTCSVKVYLEIPFSEYKRVFEAWYNDEDLASSPFFIDNYTNLDSLNVEKVGNTRNLIYIIMESMENWDDSLIPELIRLEQENIHFTSVEGKVSGGREIAGSTCTITATVSKTTGVPYLSANYTGDTILPNVKSIYDVMNFYDYHNTFLQGTDARFANLNFYLNAHGVNDVYDIKRLSNYSDMDPKLTASKDYRPGISDRSLYEIAKLILDTLSKKNNFSLTIATIDSHFPIGFYNDKCSIKPQSGKDEDMLRAAIQCASKDVYDFVKWVESKSFGKNTEIVIVGDHVFKGKLLIDHPDRRWVDIFINPLMQPKNTLRDFSSVDIAPSILESMGFIIPGHRMGFGTSLFSDEPTILESGMDYKSVNIQISKMVRSPEYYHLSKRIIE